MIGVVSSYIAVLLAGGFFGVLSMALVIAASDRDRDEDIKDMEISPDEARRSKKKIIEYTARHNSCRTCIFITDCNNNWKCCPTEWETKQ